MGRQLASKTNQHDHKEHWGLLSWVEQLAKGNGLLWAMKTAGICRGGWNAICSIGATH
ncbi:hypothetical protein LQL77_30040 [Rhodococcus cerastii]|nr:hypothetical protein [Rhodococcus cerastii]